MSDGRCCIVVPCYNEAQRLAPDAFLAHLEASDDCSFLFVDDGSTDATPSTLASLAREAAGRVAVLTLDSNQGKAEAVRRGLLEAFASAPECAGYWDADLATPLSEIDALRQVLAEYPDVDLVLGSRVQLMGRQIERRAMRHYIGRVCATAISATLGLPIYDTQCGAKLLRFSDATSAILQTPFVTDWIFDVELIARLIEARTAHGRPTHDHVLRELPLRAWRDVGGSKLRPGDYLRSALDLVRIYRRYSSGGRR